jgi:hypothetical protein
MRQRPPSSWPVLIPVPAPPSPPSLHSPPCLSPSQALSSSPFASSQSSTVRPSLLFPPRVLRRSYPLPFAVPPHIRHIRCPVRRMRQGPLQQAAAKSGREPPPDPSLGRPFRPHNLGSCLARTSHPCHLHSFLLSFPSCCSTRPSIQFASSSPTIRARQIRARMCTSST